MKLIVDTNLLFSAVSKQNGRIAEIMLNPNYHLELIGCYFSFIELFKYKDKLIKLSKLKESEFLEVMYHLFKRIHFYNEGIISETHLKKAYLLTEDIDPKDSIFIAMSLHLEAKLWTGDFQLVAGLRNKGFGEIILTSELIELLSK